ncbi:MAG: hypothetical protein ACE5R6_02725 [Candidatus Heimdallarchaeota archaeon]
MKNRIWILSLIGLLTLLAFYSDFSLSPREIEISDLVNNTKSYENTVIYAEGRVKESPIYEDDTLKYTIVSTKGDETILLITIPSQLNKMPRKGDLVTVKGFLVVSESQTYIEVYEAHIRTIWDERSILIRSFAAIPLLCYFIRQGWGLLRV